MTGEDRWARMQDVFGRALDMPDDTRASFVRDECAGDTDLADSVMELLASHEADEGVLDAPPDVLSGGLVDDDTMIGRTVGRYRVTGVLGRGGMGAVYEAEQESPVRTVALKIVRGFGASRELVHRFRHEARALALLQHPGIAQIYEAGTFDNAQPFFAMELIRGEPLTGYAEKHGLDTDERLDLIGKVCAAVEHAHQRGVIHRDLKPGNIIVDESGQPKVLDFGVARMTDSDVKATIETSVGQVVGTLAYMSPEQAGGNPDEVDTRSDIYSLGVVLYELLTGELPYDTAGRPIHEAVTIIRDQNPTRPSTRVVSLRGDLETILLHALEKDKDRRYQTVAGLGFDIGRFRRNEPITARPASTAYRVRKFVRRNRALVGGLAGVMFVLVAAVIGISLFAVETARQRDLAVAAGAEATAVNEFFGRIMTGADPWQSGVDVKVADLLDDAAAEVEQMFADQPLVRARVRNEIATGFYGLRMIDKAQAQWEAALATRDRLLGAEHVDTVMILNNLALIDMATGRRDRARERLELAIEVRRRELGPDDHATLRTATSLASLMHADGEDDEAEALLRDTIERQRRVLGADYLDTLTTMNNLALLMLELDREEEAEATFRAVAAGFARRYGDDHPQTHIAKSNLARTLKHMKRYDEAEVLFLEAIAGLTRLSGGDGDDVFVSRYNLARLYTEQERHDEAERLYADLVEDAEALWDDSHSFLFTFKRRHGESLIVLGRYEEAETLLLPLYDFVLETKGADSRSTRRVRDLLIRVYEAQGRAEDAATLRGE